MGARPNRAGGRDQTCAEQRGRSNLSAADFNVVDAFETVIECRFDAFCGEQDTVRPVSVSVVAGELANRDVMARMES